MTWDLLEFIRVRFPTKRISRNFGISDLFRVNGLILSRICMLRLFMIIPVQIFTSSLYKTIWRHNDVIRGHRYPYINNPWLDENKNVKLASMCLSRQDGSNAMQHDLLDRDRKVIVKFQTDFSRSYYISFKPVWRDKNDGTNIISVASADKKLLAETIFPTKGLFWTWVTSGG